MVAFQSSVAIVQGFGVPGEIFLDGPTRAQPLLLDSADAAYNIIGATAFTVKSEGVAEAGGDGPFAGILAAPKSYASQGTAAAGTLAPTLTLPNDTVAEFVTMGQIIVTLPAAAAIGDIVLFDNTTGALSTQAPSSSFTGVVATNTLTVSSFVAGGAPLKVGTVISGAGVTPGTVISALGTGTGGNGTYTVTGAATVSSTTMTGSSEAPSGKTKVPNATVDRYTVSGAGLGVITITD